MCSGHSNIIEEMPHGVMVTTVYDVLYNEVELIHFYGHSFVKGTIHSCCVHLDES